MTNYIADSREIVERLETLERQNRRMKRIGRFAVLVPALLLATCHVQRSQVVEAQRILLRDSQDRIRIEISTRSNFPYTKVFDWNSGQVDSPAITLLDGEGKVRTVIRDGELTLLGQDEKPAVTVLGQKQRRIDLTRDAGDVKVESLPSLGPAIEVLDSKGFRALLGSARLKSARTGGANETSAASLVLLDKENKVLWSAP